MNWRWHKRWNAFWVREEQKAKQAIDGLDLENGWFDLWHTHPDWKSKGNRSLAQRRNVAKLTYKLLVYAENCVQQRRKTGDVQVFATICADTGNNGIFLHTANPNTTAYPFMFDGIAWGSEGRGDMDGIINPDTHELGVITGEHGADYYIRRRTKL